MGIEIIEIDRIDRLRQTQEPPADLEKIGALYGEIDVSDDPIFLFRQGPKEDDSGNVWISL